jgi:hypothetical protein
MDSHVYVIMFVSDFWQVGGFLRVLLFPPPINLPPRYIWNIVESGINMSKKSRVGRSVGINFLI